MKQPTVYLYQDQYGRCIMAATRKELRDYAGWGRVSIMYQDKLDGTTVNVGYAVGDAWFIRYAPAELPA